MGSYRIEIKRSAESDLRGVPFPFRRQINARFFKLKETPCPEGCEEVPETENAYRLRVSGWSIVYTVDHAARSVTVYAIVK